MKNYGPVNGSGEVDVGRADDEIETSLIPPSVRTVDSYVTPVNAPVPFRPPVGKGAYKKTSPPINGYLICERIP
jgi:hypothetical protein